MSFCPIQENHDHSGRLLSMMAIQLHKVYFANNIFCMCAYKSLLLHSGSNQGSISGFPEKVKLKPQFRHAITHCEALAHHSL
jgi:hypothetical protein